MAATLELVIRGKDLASDELRKVESALDGIGGAVDKRVAGPLSRFSSAIGGVAKTALIGLGGVGVAVGGLAAITGFNFDNMKQQAQIAFETMLGSGKKAKTFLDELQAFAAKTPFEFPELVQSSQKLLAMGFTAEEVLPTLTSIGDAVAGLGGGAGLVDQVTRALGQMKAKGKASAEEMLQLTEAGIPAWQFLADAIGTDVAGAMKAVEARTVDADTAISAITTGMNTRFGGLMEKQSHTFGGLLSTLKDTFSQVAGTAMAPFFEMATKGMQRLADLTSKPEFQEGVKRVAEAIQEGLRAVAEFITKKVVPAFQEIWPVLKKDVLPELFDFARVTMDVGQALAQFLAPALDTLADLYDNLKGPLSTVGNFLLDHKEILLGLAVVILAITNPWLAVIAVIAVVLAKWDEISQLFMVTIPGAIDSFLTKVREIPIIGEIFEGAFNYVRVVVETAFGLIQNRVQFFIDAIRAIITIGTGLISGDWGAAWQGVKDLFNAFWTLIKSDIETAFGGVADIIKVAMSTVGGVVGDIWDGVKGGIRDALNWIIDRLNDFAGQINKVLGPLNTMLGLVGLGVGKIPSIGHIGGAINLAVPIPPMQHGGYVPPGVVTPAVLHGPEYVIPASRMGAGTTIINNFNSKYPPDRFAMEIEGREMMAWVERQRRRQF